MSESSRRLLLIAAIAGILPCTAQADVYFSDNMEAQTFPLATPPIGWGYSTEGSTGDQPVSLGAPAPGASNKAIKLRRVPDSSLGPVLGVFANTNALAAGNTVEFSFDLFHQYIHTGNAPLQVGIGLPPYNQSSLGGLLEFLNTNDNGANNTLGWYHYSNDAGTPIRTSAQNTLNGWDRVRAVLNVHVESYPGFGDYLTGTGSFYVRLNGSPLETTLATNVALPYAPLPPADDPLTVGLDERNAGYMRFAKGPVSGDDYYDNIYVGSPSAPYAVSTWNVNGAGSWSVGGNWTPSNAPNGVGTVASFGSVNTSAVDITVDSPRTVSGILFSSANSYSLVGNSSITFDSPNAAAGIRVTAGSHTIFNPVVMSKDLGVTTDAGTSLVIKGPISAAGKILSKSGTGSITLENFQGAGLFVSQGIGKITKKSAPNDPSGTVAVGTLTVSALAQLDLTNNSAIINYDTLSTQVEDMRVALKEARVFSSAAGDGRNLGYGDNAVLGIGSFAGQTVDATSLLVRFTWYGDSNLDGKVNTVDFNMLAGGFGSTSGHWTDGDYDYNHTVDSVDFDLFVASYGKTSADLGPTLGSVVPEPASLSLLALGSAMLIRRRREGGA